MSAPSTKTVYRKDYTPPTYWIDRVELEFDLEPTETVVAAKLFVRRNDQQDDRRLTLDGEKLSLQSIRVDGVLLTADQYELTEDALVVDGLPDQCVVETSVIINPSANKALSGLYRTSGNFCTQCEAQGFRRITFFPDRPDVMSQYRVTIRGDRTMCPIMLSNGNRISQRGLTADGTGLFGWTRTQNRVTCSHS